MVVKYKCQCFTVDIMSDKLPDNRRENRGQKNLQMGEFYRKELLPNLAKSQYGSTEKQGQIVEDILDYYVSLDADNNDVVAMIEDIHAAVVGARTTHPPTSDDVVDGGDNFGDEVSELLRKAKEGEPIDPDEHDLSVIKGGSGIDRASIVAQAVLTTPTTLDIASIKEFCRREVGYSPNRARDLSEEVMWELEDLLYDPVPGRDWVKEQVEEDIRQDRHNAREGGEGMSKSMYRREYAKSVEAYAGARADLPQEGPYVDEQEAADAVYEALNTLLNSYKSGTTHQSRRAGVVIQKIWDRTDPGVRDTKPSQTDSTIKFIVATNDDLKNVVMGDD